MPAAAGAAQVNVKDVVDGDPLIVFGDECVSSLPDFFRLVPDAVSVPASTLPFGAVFTAMLMPALFVPAKAGVWVTTHV